MAIPLATTTISATRAPAGADPYDPTPTADIPVVAGVRAVISAPSGTGLQQTGTAADYTYTLNADPCDLRPGDRIIDDTTAEPYLLVWGKQETGLGLDHFHGSLRATTGASR